MKDRSKLTTEKHNPKSRDIDRRSTLEIVDLINAEDRKVASAVRKERKRIAKAVDIIAESFRRGGRLFYVGCGTSGRLGVLDASECPPTFGVPPSRVQGIIAGGRRALVRSSEGMEDHEAGGAAAIDQRKVKPRDTVVGIAACGMTPYVRGALRRARKIGAKTVFITCSPEVKREVKADVVICPVVGPEVVTGSTRMKAGTATKLVLNTLTTAAMIRTGKVYGNLMVDLSAKSEKLRDRAERIIMTVAGVSRPRARKLLKDAHGEAKIAVVMHFRKMTYSGACRRLKACGGLLRDAIQAED
ncbi:MAG TPA: N-acetylmuramic acid 6-phosphate etherase [Planctomycetota bacterium]|nr:N-acetylmuramic acid 6-phosphate etherase [Planctomycetota bacterium]